MKSFLRGLVDSADIIESTRWQEDLVNHDTNPHDNHLGFLSTSSSSSFSSEPSDGEQNNEINGNEVNNDEDEESISSASIQQEPPAPQHHFVNDGDGGAEEDMRGNQPQLNEAQIDQEGINDHMNNVNPTHQPQHQTATTGTQEGIDQALYQKILSNIRNHERHNDLIFRVARSEELPLIKADIHWPKVLKELPTYPNEIVGDMYGSVLLQSILRMDAPISIVETCIELYPKSCVNMDPFYAACQYTSEETVKVVLNHTVQARKEEGIHWGMVAFLGDARISKRHAMFLLQSAPQALLDPSHGHFGVSPLDRMISGAFIHGESGEWVSKLLLALEVAERGFIDDEAWDDDKDNGNKRKKTKRQKFYPYHALIRRLCSPDYMGVQFGELTFTRTLMACIKCSVATSSKDVAEDPGCDVLSGAIEAAGPFHQLDDEGNLPIHVALNKLCHTNLGCKGERKLIYFLLHSYPQSAMVRNVYGKGDLPLRLSVANGWPVYDLIHNACPQACKEKHVWGDESGDLSLHTLLDGVYHYERYGVQGARKIVKYFIAKNPLAAKIPNGQGRLPLHLALQFGWPCHDLIFTAAPMALETRDVTNGLYPFQIFASKAMNTTKKCMLDKQHHLDALFELVRESPLVTRGMAIKGGNRKSG